VVKFGEADPNIRTRGFEAISRRIIALSHVYDHLLATGLSQTIEFSQYLSSVCSALLASAITNSPGVKIAYELVRVTTTLDAGSDRHRTYCKLL
jgi:two-component sensor histidine kinase